MVWGRCFYREGEKLKVIDNIVKVKVDIDKYIYLNTLNGAVDVIEEDVHNIMNKWTKSDVVDEENDEVFNFMKSRGYILNEEQEKEIKSNLFSKLRYINNKQKNLIQSIHLVLTYDCNFKCSYCYEKNVNQYGEAYVKAKMSEDMVDCIFERYGNTIKHVHLFGGEPLLEENLGIIKYILGKKLDVFYEITTNGYNLESYLDIFKGYDLKQINVTLDGREEVHNKNRFLKDGQGTYQPINKGIEKALRLNIPVKIRMNISEVNYKESELLCDELLERFHKHKNLIKIHRNTLFSKTGCGFKTLETMFNEGDKKRSEINKGLETFSPLVKQLLGVGKWTPKFVGCNALVSGYYFDPHGDIYICPLSVGDKSHSVGTYYPIEQIDLNNPWLNRTIEDIEECKSCSKALLCGGGCAIAAYNGVGKVDAPACRNVNFLIEKVVPILFEKFIKNTESTKEI